MAVNYTTGNKSKTAIKELSPEGSYAINKIDLSTDVIDTNISNGRFTTTADSFLKKVTNLVDEIEKNYDTVSSKMKAIDDAVKAYDNGKRTEPHNYIYNGHGR